MQKILLVDDTRLLLEIVKSYLLNSPVQVLTASNGEEALEIANKERPDLVVLDQNMPKMNGIDCCAAMRRNPALVEIPVIMISGSSSMEDRQAFVQAGCSDFLAKPIVRGYFLAKVRSFLPAVEQRAERVPCRTPVAMEIAGVPFSGVSEDISRGGVYVATDHEMIAGGKISLRFRLPGNVDNSWITARGRVAWLNSARKKVSPHLREGFGVEFLEITGEGLPILRKNEIIAFVESRRKQEN